MHAKDLIKESLMRGKEVITGEKFKRGPTKASEDFK